MGRGKNSKTSVLYTKHDKEKGRLEDSYEDILLNLTRYKVINILMKELAKYTNKNRAIDIVVTGLTEIARDKKKSCTPNRKLIEEPRLNAFMAAFKPNFKTDDDDDFYNYAIPKMCNIIILLIDGYIKYYTKMDPLSDSFCEPLEYILNDFMKECEIDKKKDDDDLILVYLDDE